MYRVDNKVDGLTNNAGKNYIYVYRPGVTHPEAGADVGAINKAALDVTAGGTSYGTTDLNADFTQNTLYYSDGSNSGIRISDLKLSAAEMCISPTAGNHRLSGEQVTEYEGCIFCGNSISRSGDVLG